MTPYEEFLATSESFKRICERVDKIKAAKQREQELISCGVAFQAYTEETMKANRENFLLQYVGL